MGVLSHVLRIFLSRIQRSKTLLCTLVKPHHEVGVAYRNEMCPITPARIMEQMFGILACKFPQQKAVPIRLSRILLQGPPPLACPPALSSEAGNSDGWCNGWFAQAKKFCTSCQKYLRKTHLQVLSGDLTRLRFVIVSEVSVETLTSDGVWHLKRSSPLGWF